MCYNKYTYNIYMHMFLKYIHACVCILQNNYSQYTRIMQTQTFILNAINRD